MEDNNAMQNVPQQETESTATTPIAAQTEAHVQAEPIIVTAPDEHSIEPTANSSAASEQQPEAETTVDTTPLPASEPATAENDSTSANEESNDSKKEVAFQEPEVNYDGLSR